MVALMRKRINEMLRREDVRRLLIYAVERYINIYYTENVYDLKEKIILEDLLDALERYT